MGKHRAAKTGKKPVGRVRTLLASLFSKDKPGTETGRFEVSILDMVEESGSVVMGRVHMVNLRDLVVKRDKNTDEMLERARTIADGVISEHLDDGDVYSRGEDGAYYFLFPDMSEEAGALKCSVIVDQIARLLSAENPIFFKLDIDNTVGTVDKKNLDDAVPGKSRGKGAADPEEIRRRLLEAREKRQMENVIASVTPREDLPPDKDLSAVPENDTDEPEPDRPPPEGMSVMYGSIWNVKTKLLAAYSCIVMVREADGSTMRFTLKQRAEHHRQTLLALDRYTQRKATARLRELLDSGERTLVVLPVHFMTVEQDTSSLLYRQGLSDLTDAERRHIVLELVDLPPGLPGIRINRTIRNLRRVARTVMARVPIDTTNLDSWQDTGVHAVGFDLGTYRIDQQALLPNLEKFAEEAEKHDLRKFIYGIDSISAGTMAIAAGFDYIEGDAVCPPVESLAHARPFDSEDLLAGLLPSGP